MRTTYYQTFTYCADCHPQAASALGLRRWGVFAAVEAIFAWILLFVAFVDLVRDPATGTAAGLRGAVAIAAATAMAIAQGAAIYLAARAIKRRRHPPRPGQAAWGLAAFYTGGTAFGFNNAFAVYKAARPEWIAALVRANPDQVDDAVYRSHVGTARPSIVPAGRPFGPA